jgi:hypothetical protein
VVREGVACIEHAHQDGVAGASVEGLDPREDR